jgi:hypothetical protein
MLPIGGYASLKEVLNAPILLPFTLQRLSRDEENPGRKS